MTKGRRKRPQPVRAEPKSAAPRTTGSRSSAQRSDAKRRDGTRLPPWPDDDQLPARERGPVRAYVRDAVDARGPRPILLFMPAFALGLICAFGPPSELAHNILLGCLAVLAVVILDAVLLGRSIIRMSRAEFPKSQISGPATGWYVFMRAHRPRSMRLPRPRVSPG